MPAAAPGRKLVTLKAGAEVTDTSIRTLRRRIAEGELPAYRIGPRAIRVRLEDVEALARPIPTGDVDAPPAAPRTAPARAALDKRFLHAADGDPVRAAHLRKAHIARLALKSAQARRKAREATTTAEAADAKLSALGGGADAV